MPAANDPVAAILDQARGTRVEIFADVIFHLLDTSRIPDKDRVPLLEEVFLRADEARQTMPMRSAIPVEMGPRPSPETVTRDGQTITLYRSATPAPGSKMVAVPAQLHLDALAIKCRVVKALLAIDAKRARDRFEQIAAPHTGKPDCTAGIIFDPTGYYDALAAVVTQGTFTAKEQEKKVPFWMLENAIRRVQTSIEIIAAARNFSQLAHTPDEALVMSSAFAAALGMDDSNRNFTAATKGTNLVDAVLIANDRFVKLGASPQTMMTALRSYLVRHLSATRCADNGNAPYETSLQAFATAIGLQTAIPPITAEEIIPAKVEGVADTPAPVDHAAYDQLWNETAAIGDNLDGSANDVLARIEAWKGADGQDPTDIFRKKLALCYRLQGPSFTIRSFGGPAPGDPGPTANSRASREAMVAACAIATLSDPVFLDASPSDWLSEVQKLEQHQTTRVTRQSAGQTLSQEVIPSEFSLALIGSSLSALSVYGHSDVLEHSSPSWYHPPDRLF
jgi:hypothetical protein